MTPQRDPEIPAPPVVRSHDDARPPHRDESGPSSRPNFESEAQNACRCYHCAKDGFFRMFACCAEQIATALRTAYERGEVAAWGDRREMEREAERLRSRLAATREALLFVQKWFAYRNLMDDARDRVEAALAAMEGE